MLTNEKKKILKDRIEERIDTFSCPMCHNDDFIIGDGYFINVLNDNLSKLTLEGKGIPTIPIICKNCGFISQHALGMLELLSGEENED